MNIFKRLTLGSKILLAMLLASLLSMFLTGWVGYVSGRDGIKTAVFHQLESIRNIQADNITKAFNRNLNWVLEYSSDPNLIQATKEFKVAVAKLHDVPISPEQRAKLVDYYNKNFIPQLEKNTDSKRAVDNFLPYSPGQEYLQYEYIANNPFKDGQKDRLNDSNDRSEYSAVHKKYHPRIRYVIDKVDYDDFYIVDSDTGVVLYSKNKMVDFLTNLKDGPYSNSGVAKAFQRSRQSTTDLEYVGLEDYEIYIPTYGEASAFVHSPIYDGKKMIGVVIVRISGKKLDRLLTYNGNWEQAGLGKTGETFLVGQDHLFRTTSRRFLEHRAEYLKSFKEHGYDPAVLERVNKQNTPVLTLDVHTESVNEALSGKTGSILDKSSGGLDVLSSFQPINIGNFRWALVARKEQSEAFSAIDELTKRLIITAAVLVPLITLLSLYLSRMLSSPIARLIAAVKKIAAGEKNVRIKVDTRDEIGRLSNTFNDMASSIDEKNQIIEEKIAENNRLLLNVLPGPVAKRLQSGEQDIADSFSNVTIIYVEIEGFSNVAENRDANQSMRMLQELISSFDDTAEEYGIEKQKTIGSAYVAVCGLTIPRLDHIKRSVDFAFSLLKQMNSFNQRHGTNLGLDIGLNSGPVVAGVIGKTKFIYELWGETMNIAQLIHSCDGTNNVQVSESVHSALVGQYDFQPVDNLMVKGKGNIPVWKIYPLNFLSLSDRDEVKA